VCQATDNMLGAIVRAPSGTIVSEWLIQLALLGTIRTIPASIHILVRIAIVARCLSLLNSENINMLRLLRQSRKSGHCGSCQKMIESIWPVVNRQIDIHSTLVCRFFEKSVWKCQLLWKQSARVLEEATHVRDSIWECQWFESYSLSFFAHSLLV
jgi:hypothetical protein